MFDKKEDLFALLRTRYRELPDERKAAIITAYSKMAGLPLFDAFARWKQARLAPEPLAKLVITAIAQAIYEKSEDVFILLKTKYKDLPNECKAGIIAAYSKLIPGDQLLSVAMGCAQLSDLAMFDMRAKKFIKRAAFIEKNNLLKINVDHLISSGLVSTRQELLNGKILSQEKLQAFDKLSLEFNNFLASFKTGNAQSWPLPAQWNVYLTGEANSPRVACILETDAPSCIFARTALEIVHRLASHEFFEDQQKQQPLTRICLLENQNHDNSLLAYQKQWSVDLIAEALMALLPQNDWVHAVRQLMLENEERAEHLLLECLEMRPAYTSGVAFVELYFWACVFDRQTIKKCIELIAPAYGTVLKEIQTLHDKLVTRQYEDGDHEYGYERDLLLEGAKPEAIKTDLLPAACRGDYSALVGSYADIREVERQRVPYPGLLFDGRWLLTDLLGFACEMGYTGCVDVLLAKGFQTRRRALAYALAYGRSQLVRKIFDDGELDYYDIPFRAIFRVDPVDKLCGEWRIKGKSSEALKIFIDCDIAAQHEYRVFDFAQLFAGASLWENREIFDYLMNVVNSNKCDLTVEQKKQMLGLALCLAVAQQAPLPMVELLVRAGAPVNTSQFSHTLEHITDAETYHDFLRITGHALYDAINGCPDIEVVRYLLSMGARDDAFEYYHEQVTACRRAQGRGLGAIAELLRPVLVEGQPTGEQATDVQSGDEQP